MDQELIGFRDSGAILVDIQGLHSMATLEQVLPVRAG